MRAAGTLAGLPSTLVTIHAVEAAAAAPTTPCPANGRDGHARVHVRRRWQPAAASRCGRHPPHLSRGPVTLVAGAPGRRARASTPSMRDGTAFHPDRDARCTPQPGQRPDMALAGPRRRSACGARWPLPGGTHFRTRARDAERRRDGDRSPPLRAASRVATLSRAVRNTPRGPAMPARRLRTGPRPGRACPAPASGRRAADAAPARPTG